MYHHLPKTSEHLSDASFTVDKIAKIINNLDLAKALGHDMISICKLKLCNKSIFKPMELIFKSCLVHETFPFGWKKANVISVHKKNDKKSLKLYRQISLLPICNKIFQHLTCNNMYIFFK